jgi:oxalate decarboxylase/phosphoglucose isomerase-like protein (cupin superfamily)
MGPGRCAGNSDRPGYVILRICRPGNIGYALCQALKDLMFDGPTLKTAFNLGPAYGKHILTMTKKFNLLQSAAERFAGGEIQRANKKSFAVLEGLALQSIVLEPGGKREAHSHPNAAQMDFVVSGSARIGIVGVADDIEIHNVIAGDVTFVPQGYFHWIENTSTERVHFLLILNNAEAETIEFSNVLRALSS